MLGKLEVDIAIEPFASGKTSVSWSFAVFCDGVMVAEGILTTVRVDGVGKPSDIPEVLKNKINASEEDIDEEED